MRLKVTLCAAAALLAVGCKGVEYTSMGAYRGAQYEVACELQALGFSPVGTGQETVNEPYLVDDEWKNDWVTYDTRTFADSLGNTAAYTVRYSPFEDGMQSVLVSGCEVSSPEYFAAVCGDDGATQRLNVLKPDRRATDGNLTAAAVVLGTSVAVPLVIGVLLAVFMQ